MTTIGKLNLRPGIERRSHRRATALDIPTRVVVPSGQPQAANSELRLHAVSINGGLLHGRFDRDLVRGETVEIQLELADTTISLRAEIVRVEIQDARNDAISVAFRDVPPSARELIERFVASTVESTPTS